MKIYFISNEDMLNGFVDSTNVISPSTMWGRLFSERKDALAYINNDVKLDEIVILCVNVSEKEIINAAGCGLSIKDYKFVEAFSIKTIAINVLNRM